MKASYRVLVKMLNLTLSAVVAIASLGISVQAQDSGPLRVGKYAEQNGSQFEGIMVGVSDKHICVFKFPEYTQHRIPRGSLPKEQQLWASELDRQIAHLLSPITGEGKLEGVDYSRQEEPARLPRPKTIRIREGVNSRDGRVQHFAETGKLFEATIFKDALRTGLTVELYPDGTIYSILYSSKNASILKTTFYKDGIAKSLQLYRNGKQVVESGYHSNGIKLGFAEIKNDNLNGDLVLSTNGGVLAAEVKMKDGQPTELVPKINDEKLVVSLFEEFLLNRLTLQEAWTNSPPK